ncbi:MAG: DUF1592 domain-containing protein [Bradymonadia bacterium]
MKHARTLGLTLTRFALWTCFLSLGCRSPGVPTEPTVPSDTMEMMNDSGQSSTGLDSGLPQNESYVIQPAVLPRLTATQYINTVEDIFGENLPVILLESDTNPDLFYSIGATSTDVTERAIELYSAAADQIASYALSPERRAETIGCSPITLDDPCVSLFVQRIGRRLFRRPLTTNELAQWLDVATELGESDLNTGLKYALSGMLQSPFFLYRVVTGMPDPVEQDIMRLTPFEMASRLSFTLLNRGPDERLLDAAQNNELVDPQSIREHAERLLSEPEARTAVENFFAQYLDLKRLDETYRPLDRHPNFSPRLINAMEMEVKLLVSNIVFDNPRDIRGLFSEPQGYVNSDLADLYEIEVEGLTPNIFVPVTFDETTPRAGILTLGAFLTMNAHPTDTSPTLRGKYIRERVFCQEVPAPPDDIDLNLEQDEGEADTLRERLEAHREDPECAACHSFIDPPGFLFENYDGLGKYRTDADGHPVDATGELDGVPLNNAVELAAHLEDNATLIRCMVTQLYRHTQGRREEPDERPMLRALEDEFALSGYDFKSLMLALVQSPGFRTVSAEGVMP